MNIASKAIDRATNRYPHLPPRAALVAEFIESFCTLSKGSNVSSPFVLIPWQYEVLAGLYPGMPGDKRLITRAIISMARKQGKTEFCSAILLAHLCGPEAGTGQEIVCAAASSQDQAGLVFNGSRTMLQNNPDLARHTTFRTNRIIWKINDANNYAKTISTKYSSAQGLLPALWFLDEIAEMTDRELYESLNYAQTDQEMGGLGIIISTRSNRPNSLFTVLHDEAVLGQQNGINKHWLVKVWSADPKASNVLSMEQLRKANPSIGYTVSEEMLQRELDNAIAHTSARAEFRARRLNIESGTADSLIDQQKWLDAAAPDSPIPLEETLQRMKGRKVVIGIDLGHSRSMTAMALYWPQERFVVGVNWMAKAQVKTNETLHKAPYSAWSEDGYLHLVESEHGGKGMSYRPIAELISRCFKDFDVLSIRYDGWNMVRLWDALKRYDLHIEEYPIKGVKDEFIQGTRSYGEAIIEFEDMMEDEVLKHDGNPVTNMAINVCQVETTNRTADNLKKPAKNKQNLPNDSAVAILMAISQRGLVNLYDDGDGDAFLEGLTGVSNNDIIPDNTNDADPYGLMDLLR